MLLVVLAGYFLTTVPGVRPTAGFNVLIDGWVQNGLTVAAGLAVLVRACWVREDRAAWLMMAIAICLYAFGNILYFGWVQYRDPLPFPSMADVPWLAFYVFPYVGIVLLVRSRVRVFHRSVWLDGVIGAFGASALASLILAVIVRHTTGSKAAVMTTLAYPVGDLLLLVLVVGVYGLLGWRPDRMWGCIGLGLLCFGAADTIYVARVATGTFQAGTMLDPLWVVGLVVVALGALRTDRASRQLRLDGWAVLVIPSLFTFSSLALLVYGSMHDLPRLTVLLATAAVVGGIVRAALTFREVQSLYGVRHQARTDDLTGLGNRRALVESFEAALHELPEGAHHALLILDLDRFKEVNDSLGHTLGDQLLVEVGRRLAGGVREGDLLIRLGGDEFAVHLADADRDAAVEVAARLRADLQQAFTLDGILVHIDASIGIAVCPDVATTVTGLLQRADIAMYQAKSERLGCAVYEAADDEDLMARLRLVDDLRQAIVGGQLVLHYQMKYDLGSGRPVGAEALVRWQHPTRGLLFPDAFIGEVERSGFMRGLTSVVLGMALDQAKEWQLAGTPVRVAVNVSASSLLDVELPDQVADMIVSRGLPPSLLVIEITESTLMAEPARALVVLNRLHELGVRISIDDYGTGYSSLAYLRDLPIDELKLDRSFVAELDTDRRVDAIVQSTIQLAHSLGLLLVAEGIESATQLAVLSELGCDIGQGYLLARPCPPDRLALPKAGAMVPVQRSEVAAQRR